MRFNFNEKSGILFFFFLSGVVLGLVLLIRWRNRNHLSDLFLSLFSFLSALYISPFLLGYAGWYRDDPYRRILFYTPLQHLFWIPPVLYLYTRSLLDRSFFMDRKKALHFLPGALYLIYIISLWLIDWARGFEHGFYADGRDKDLDAWYQVLGFVCWIYYLTRVVQDYRRYLNLTYESVSFADRARFQWLRMVLLLFLVLVLLRLLFFVLNPEWDQFGNKYWYYLSFSIVSYMLILLGYGNKTETATDFSVFSPSTTSNNPVLDSVPGQSFSLPPEEQKRIQDQILVFVETGKGFQNPLLTLADLSQATGIHPKKLSWVINQVFGKNFNDFINGYRVSMVAQKLKEGEHRKQTLMGLAYDAGFNSKSTFIRAFRKETGLSPSEYIQKFVSNPDLGRATNS